MNVFISKNEEVPKGLQPGGYLVLNKVMFNHLKNNPDEVPDFLNHCVFIEAGDIPVSREVRKK